MSILKMSNGTGIGCVGSMHLVAASIVVVFVALLSAPPTTAADEVALTPESPLPKVLIIGDSISIGYTTFVTQILAKEAVVKHHKGNAGPTSNGLKLLDRWLAKQK